jgi:hypothetical protein
MIHGLAPVATTCRHFVAETQPELTGDVPDRTNTRTQLHHLKKDTNMIRITLALTLLLAAILTGVRLLRAQDNPASPAPADVLPEPIADSAPTPVLDNFKPPQADLDTGIEETPSLLPEPAATDPAIGPVLDELNPLDPPKPAGPVDNLPSPDAASAFARNADPFAVVQESDVVATGTVLAPAKPATSDDRRSPTMQIFHLKHMLASDAARTAERLIDGRDLTVVPDERTNSLIVRGREEDFKDLIALLEQLDSAEAVEPRKTRTRRTLSDEEMMLEEKVQDLRGRLLESAKSRVEKTQDGNARLKELAQQIRSAFDESFNERQRQQLEEIEDLTASIHKLSRAVREREADRAAIIEKRLSQLIGDATAEPSKFFPDESENDPKPRKTKTATGQTSNQQGNNEDALSDLLGGGVMFGSGSGTSSGGTGMPGGMGRGVGRSAPATGLGGAGLGGGSGLGTMGLGGGMGGGMGMAGMGGMGMGTGSRGMGSAGMGSRGMGGPVTDTNDGAFGAGFAERGHSLRKSVLNNIDSIKRLEEKLKTFEASGATPLGDPTGSYARAGAEFSAVKRKLEQDREECTTYLKLLNIELDAAKAEHEAVRVEYERTERDDAKVPVVKTQAAMARLKVLIDLFQSIEELCASAIPAETPEASSGKSDASPVPVDTPPRGN